MGLCCPYVSLYVNTSYYFVQCWNVLQNLERYRKCLEHANRTRTFWCCTSCVIQQGGQFHCCCPGQKNHDEERPHSAQHHESDIKIKDEQGELCCGPKCRQYAATKIESRDLTKCLWGSVVFVATRIRIKHISNEEYHRHSPTIFAAVHLAWSCAGACPAWLWRWHSLESIRWWFLERQEWSRRLKTLCRPFPPNHKSIQFYPQNIQYHWILSNAFKYIQIYFVHFFAVSQKSHPQAIASLVDPSISS